MTSASLSRERGKPHLPGEEGVWVFILGDMMVFALFFCVFLYYRGQNPELFRSAQASLHVGFGAFNTLLLLTSSWFVVQAVDAARTTPGQRAPLLFAMAGACGLGFVIVKFFEYREKILAGLTITSNDFFMYYFVLTGIHLLHVLIGLGVLVFLYRRSKAATAQAPDLMLIESGASYWHMVDVLWIVLFPLLYLIK